MQMACWTVFAVVWVMAVQVLAMPCVVHAWFAVTFGSTYGVKRFLLARV